MPRKKQQDNLRVYVTQTGGYIAGNEVQRNNATLLVEDPVFATVSSDGTGYELKPVQFVAPGQKLRLYTYGLLGDAPMPFGMVAWYVKYRQKRADQAESTPR